MILLPSNMQGSRYIMHTIYTVGMSGSVKFRKWTWKLKKFSMFKVHESQVLYIVIWWSFSYVLEISISSKGIDVKNRTKRAQVISYSITKGCQRYLDKTGWLAKKTSNHLQERGSSAPLGYSSVSLEQDGKICCLFRCTCKSHFPQTFVTTLIILVVDVQL